MHRSIIYVSILFSLITAGCALHPVSVVDNSKKIPESVPPVGSYQVMPIVLSSPVGMAFGPVVETEVRRQLGEAVSPNSSFTLYVTDLTIEKSGNEKGVELIVKMEVNLRHEPVSEMSRPVMSIDVDIKAQFEGEVDISEARIAAIRAAVEALVKKLPLPVR